MTERSTKTFIGAFVLGALALLVAFILLLGSGSLGAKNPTFVLYFNTSLKGLSQGSPVYFKGIPFDTEYRAKGRLTQSKTSALADFGKSVRQTDGYGGFPFARRGGINRRNEHEFRRSFCVFRQGNLRLVLAVQFEIILA